VDERAAAVSSTELVEDLFRKEYAHLVSALTRVLGPSNVPLAEDVVHDALVSAMLAWRFGLPQDPKAWIIRAAHNRAIDIIRREQRHRSFLPELATTTALTGTIEAALAPAAESASQLAMMFAVCDPGLNRETHVTLILRWLCGLSPKEIGQAFLVDTQTIDRRLHRGRGRLRQLGRLPDVEDMPDIGVRRDSVLRSLYLLFNEGYHGSNPQDRYVRSCARTRCVSPSCCWTPRRRRIRTCTRWPPCSASTPLACRHAWTSMECSSPSRTRTGAAGTGRASSAA
jgi:RNA polymerase sigma factor (sigma-70 family)